MGSGVHVPEASVGSGSGTDGGAGGGGEGGQQLWQQKNGTCQEISFAISGQCFLSLLKAVEAFSAA